MILANGLYGYAGPAADPNKPKLPTPAQRRAVTLWAARRLAGIPAKDLTKALAIVSAHPDAESAGYSAAKSCRERLAAELASRP